jgi:hypothetical protein
MTKQAAPVGPELIRPAKRPKQPKAAKGRQVAGPLKAVVGPRTLEQALAHAVPPPRRQASAQQSGDDVPAQKLTCEPSLRALRVGQIAGGSLPERPAGRARDPWDQAQGAPLELAVPGFAKANAQRWPQPFWAVRAEVRAAVDALPQRGRMGRRKPLGAVTAKP